MHSSWRSVAHGRCLGHGSSPASTLLSATRRTTTSARKSPLRPDVFTVFSSTLVLSAAVLDSVRKIERKKEWDRAIDETKKAIDATELDHERRLALMDGNNRVYAIASGRRRKNLCAHKRPQIWTDAIDWAREELLHRQELGFADCPGVPLDLLTTLSPGQLQKFLNSNKSLNLFYCNTGRIDQSVPRRNKLSVKKKKQLEWSVFRLVINLLRQSSTPPNPHETPKDHTYETISQLLSWDQESWRAKMQDSKERLGALRSASTDTEACNAVPSPQAPKLKQPAVDDAASLTDFNNKLRQLLAEMSANDMTNLPRICALLLLNQVAPNIDTYNILLERFWQLRNSPMIDAIVDAMRLNESIVRPNEVTHEILLRYFVENDKRSQFRRYVAMMNARLGGFNLSKPELAWDQHLKSRVHVRGTGGRKVTARSRINGDVYDALISGLIKIGSAGDAVAVFKDMIREGWKPSMEILSAILRSCADTEDVKAGFKAWEWAEELNRLGIQMSESTIRSMLNLCDVACEEHLYDRIFQQHLLDGAPWDKSTVSGAGSEPGSQVSYATLRRRFRYIPYDLLREKVATQQAEKKFMLHLFDVNGRFLNLHRLDKEINRLKLDLAQLTEKIADSSKPADSTPKSSSAQADRRKCVPKTLDPHGQPSATITANEDEASGQIIELGSRKERVRQASGIRNPDFASGWLQKPQPLAEAHPA